MKWAAIILIRIYQWCLSPFFGQKCRFYPSCSEYACEAFKSWGFIKGLWLMCKRIIKCHPWHAGGVDLVPEKPLQAKKNEQDRQDCLRQQDIVD